MICQVADRLNQDLFSHIAELSEKLSEVRMELKEKKMLVRSLFDTDDKSKDQIEKLQNEKACCPIRFASQKGTDPARTNTVLQWSSLTAIVCQ